MFIIFSHTIRNHQYCIGPSWHHSLAVIASLVWTNKWMSSGCRELVHKSPSSPQSRLCLTIHPDWGCPDQTHPIWQWKLLFLVLQWNFLAALVTFGFAAIATNHHCLYAPASLNLGWIELKCFLSQCDPFFKAFVLFIFQNRTRWLLCSRVGCYCEQSSLCGCSIINQTWAPTTSRI